MRVVVCSAFVGLRRSGVTNPTEVEWWPACSCKCFLCVPRFWQTPKGCKFGVCKYRDDSGCSSAVAKGKHGTRRFSALCAAKAEPSTQRRSGEERNGQLEWMWLGVFCSADWMRDYERCKGARQPRPAARLQRRIKLRKCFPPQERV